jgi:hypothetical protein
MLTQVVLPLNDGPRKKKIIFISNLPYVWVIVVLNLPGSMIRLKADKPFQI